MPDLTRPADPNALLLDREIQAWRRAEDVRQYYTSLIQAVQTTNGELTPDPRPSKSLRYSVPASQPAHLGFITNAG